MLVTYQGKQGWWVKKSAILSYLTPIHSVSDLDAFLTAQE
jgi:ABC-type proline/glycine betaine transport system substrate-binding protein